jgi:hypothetical protein
MRIAMVGPFGLQPNQTMRSRALGAARPLAARGHQVSLFMPPWQTPEAADSRWEEDGVTLRYTPLRGGVAGITRALLRETLAWRPDVVHCFKPKAYSGLTAWWLWQFYRRRLRLVVDSDDWEGWGGWNELAPYTRAQKHFLPGRNAGACAIATRSPSPAARCKAWPGAWASRRGRWCTRLMARGLRLRLRRARNSALLSGARWGWRKPAGAAALQPAV